MSRIYRTIVHGHPEIRELAFHGDPKAGDKVVLDDLELPNGFEVSRVQHYPRRLDRSEEAYSVVFLTLPRRA